MMEGRDYLLLLFGTITFFVVVVAFIGAMSVLVFGWDRVCKRLRHPLTFKKKIRVVKTKILKEDEGSGAMQKASNESTYPFYTCIGFVFGLIVFLGVWIYAIASWGFLLGIMFGWIPGVISGAIAVPLWPILALVFLWIVGS